MNVITLLGTPWTMPVKQTTLNRRYNVHLPMTSGFEVWRMALYTYTYG